MLFWNSDPNFGDMLSRTTLSIDALIRDVKGISMETILLPDEKTVKILFSQLKNRLTETNVLFVSTKEGSCRFSRMNGTDFLSIERSSLPVIPLYCEQFMKLSLNFRASAQSLENS